MSQNQILISMDFSMENSMDFLTYWIGPLRRVALFLVSTEETSGDEDRAVLLWARFDWLIN